MGSIPANGVYLSHGDGDLVARYTYAPDYIDAVAVQERDLNDDQDFGDAGEVVYYMSNTLYNVYGLADADEEVVERYQYDAYGGCTVLDAGRTADAGNLSDVSNPYHFTGRRLDPETGLLQYRNRYYSSVLGRFTSRDTLEYLDGMNWYQYAGDTPLMAQDAMGLVCGSGWTDAIVPDTPHGNDFTEACTWHDECYGGCEGKAYCDRGFKRRMKEWCQQNTEANTARRKDCMLYAV